MAKNPTFPTLYNEALQINISKFKKWGYLETNHIINSTLNWSRNGQQIASISISVHTNSPQPFIMLDYNHNKEPKNYKIYLTSTPSNLNKGLIWYFICPKTNKRCRKLYLVDGYFLHREAFNGCMYETQTYSKKNRDLFKIIDPYFKSDKLYEQLYKKHLKKSYAGKPTKKYLKITEQIQRAESIPYQKIEKLMMM